MSAFFKPDNQGLAADAENAAHAPQGAAFVISGQDLGLELAVVGIAAWVFAAAQAASFAAVLLFAVGSFAVTD